MRSPLIVAALLTALTACGSPAASQTPPPAPSAVAPSSADPVNVAACGQFAKAADQLQAMAGAIGAGDATGSMLIASAAEVALEDMEGGASLAAGDVRAAMDRAVAAVQIIQTSARGSVDGTVSLGQEIQTVRLTLADVVKACGAVGSGIDLGV